MKKNHKVLAAVVVGLMCNIQVPAQINIWENTPVDKNVELTPYLVEGTGNKAVVVCPGGSYFWHDIETEGHGVARW